MVSLRLLFTLLCLVAAAGVAASGRPDPSFGENGVVVMHVDHKQPFGNEYAWDMLIDHAGRSVSVGYAVDAQFFGLLIRRMPNGTADSTFGVAGHGYLTWQGNGLSLSAVLEQEDRKLLVGGRLKVKEENTTTNVPVICRVDEGGALDPSFGTSGCRTLETVAGQPALAQDFGGFGEMRLLPDGRIVVLGDPEIREDDPRSAALVQLLPDGSDDMSFGATDTCANPAPRCAMTFTPAALKDVYRVASLAIDPNDGSIVVAGQINDGMLHVIVPLRFTAAGDYDQALYALNFKDLMEDNGGHYAGEVFISPSTGAVFLIGTVSNAAGTQYRIAIGKLHADGSLDKAFGNDGRAVYAFDGGVDFHAYAATLQKDGKLLVAGMDADTGRCELLRLNGETGAPDPAFGTNGAAITDALNAIGIDRYCTQLAVDGRHILVAGNVDVLVGEDAADTNPFLFRLDQDGLFGDGFE